MATERSNRLRKKMSLSRYNIEGIPGGVKGVYGFWCRSTGKCIYVGKAQRQSVKNRLIQEWRSSHNENLRLWISAFGKFLDVCYLPVQEGKIDKMETRLIKIWRPETNILKQKR